MNRKPKTPLLQSLQRAFQLARIANKKGIPAKELVEQVRNANYTRRKFLELSGKTAGSILLGGSLLAQSCKKNIIEEIQEVNVAIIGGGMAGLNAAYQLKKQGVIAQIYEGATRTGGRMYTATGIMAPGLTTELGGEFIDSGHQDMFDLINEFGLPIIDTKVPSELALNQQAYYFNGQHYSEAEVVEAFQVIAPQMEADINAMSDVISWSQHSPFDVSLDNMSITEYLNSIGASGLIKELLDVAYNTEYGLESGQQSCINMLFLISTDTSDDTFKIFGYSDERYKIAGGNQQLVDRLAAEVADQIYTDHMLEAVIPGVTNDRIELNFIKSNGSALAVKANHVICTIPFTMLRNVAMIYDLPKEKMQSIQTLGYGTNAKMMLGFNSRPWRDLGYTGYIFTDNGLQSGWDNSQLQAGTSGGFTIYSGGTIGVNSGSGSEADQAAMLLPKLEEIYPGVSAAYNGNAARFHWPTYPYTMGSYSCYKPGQFTTIGKAEFFSVGNFHFAGEHTSYNFQGYMNGAAVTGRRAAENVLASI